MSDIQQLDGCDSVSTSSTDSHSDTDSEDELEDKEDEDDIDDDEFHSIISVEDAQEQSQDDDDNDDGQSEDQEQDAKVDSQDEDDRDDGQSKDQQNDDQQFIPVHITDSRRNRDNLMRTRVLNPVATVNKRKEASMLLPTVAVTNFRSLGPKI